MFDNLKCGHCGKVFDEQEAGYKCVRRQTMWEPAEYEDYCPHCGANAEDAEVCQVCESCGEGFVDVEMVETELGLYCPNCARETFPELYAEIAA